MSATERKNADESLSLDVVPSGDATGSLAAIAPNANWSQDVAIVEAPSPPCPPVRVSVAPPGAEPDDALAVGATSSTYAQPTPDGSIVAVTLLHRDASDQECKRFAHGAELMRTLTRDHRIQGLLRVHSVATDGRSFESDLWTIGSVSDLPALGHALDKLLGLLLRVCQTLSSLHDSGFVHGCLCSRNILLDDDLNPILSEVMVVDVAHSVPDDRSDPYRYRAYASPSVRRGLEASIQDDVYSVGQLLYFLLAKTDPPQEDTVLRRLDGLSQAPAGLVRIVRKCTTADPSKRYRVIAEVAADVERYGQYAEVGLGHPNVEEKNLTGLSQSLLPTKRLGDKAPTSQPEILTPEPSPSSSQMMEVASGKSGPLDWLSGISLHTRIKIALITAFAVLIPIMAWVLNPWKDYQQSDARRRLQSEDVIERSRAVKMLVGSGERDLSGVSLSAGHLTDVDLSGTRLFGADLTNCDLSRSDLTGAHLDGANLNGARLAGANLTNVGLDRVLGFEAALCDDSTVLPGGWICTEGNPQQEK